MSSNDLDGRQVAEGAAETDLLQRTVRAALARQYSMSLLNLDPTDLGFLIVPETIE